MQWSKTEDYVKTEDSEHNGGRHSSQKVLSFHPEHVYVNYYKKNNPFNFTKIKNERRVKNRSHTFVNRVSHDIIEFDPNPT